MKNGMSWQVIVRIVLTLGVLLCLLLASAAPHDFTSTLLSGGW